MKINSKEIIKQNKIFLWLATATIVILMIPFLLIKFKIPLPDPGSGYEIINWDLADFIMMGILIFGSASLFVLAARKVRKKSHRIAVGLGFAIVFFWLWAELAVGVFTNWGS